MIKTQDIIDEFSPNAVLWCNDDMEDTELAAMAQVAVENKIPLMSCSAHQVARLWPWLEKSRVKIMARFMAENMHGASAPDVASSLARDIISAFRNGASGAQVFIKFSDLTNFVNQIGAVRDDLFFNKKLSIGLDILEIDSSDVVAMFENLKKIRADAVIFTLSKDRGDKSDFVGRVYGMLDLWDSNFSCALHFAPMENLVRFDQVRRLVDTMQPKLLDKLRLFIL